MRGCILLAGSRFTSAFFKLAHFFSTDQHHHIDVFAGFETQGRTTGKVIAIAAAGKVQASAPGLVFLDQIVCLQRAKVDDAGNHSRAAHCGGRTFGDVHSADHFRVQVDRTVGAMAALLVVLARAVNHDVDAPEVLHAANIHGNARVHTALRGVNPGYLGQHIGGIAWRQSVNFFARDHGHRAGRLEHLLARIFFGDHCHLAHISLQRTARCPRCIFLSASRCSSNAPCALPFTLGLQRVTFQQRVQHALNRGHALEASTLLTLNQFRIEGDHDLCLSSQLVQRRLHRGRRNRERAQCLVGGMGGRLGIGSQRRQTRTQTDSRSGHGEHGRTPIGRSTHARQTTGGHCKVLS